ncbi:hypothetical protein JW977_04695 [Candidatus Falkowbacteria bacterium]|nr:hypothetical protein [Candidatus Falkowbacteria bacterium]
MKGVIAEWSALCEGEEIDQRGIVIPELDNLALVPDPFYGNFSVYKMSGFTDDVAKGNTKVIREIEVPDELVCLAKDYLEVCKYFNKAEEEFNRKTEPFKKLLKE